MGEDLTYYQHHYRKNREKHIARATKRNREQYFKQRRYLNDLKSGSACADCGARYPDKPWRMSFDHLPGTEKLCEPSALPHKKWSMARMQAELDKCEVVCLLCHADRTFARDTRDLGCNGNTSPLQGEDTGSTPVGSIMG